MKRLLFLILSLLLAQTAWGATYYVDPNAEAYGNGKAQGLVAQYSEVLTDGGVEVWTNSTTLASWGKYISGTSTVNQETTIVHGGSSSVRVDIDASTSGVFIYQTDTLISGRPYTFTFWAKGSASFTITPGYRGATYHGLTPVTLTTDWQQFTVRFTPAENGRIEIGRTSGQGASQRFYVDDISLKTDIDRAASTASSIVSGLSAGDSMLFRSGSVNVVSTYISPPAINITFGAYGNGAKPIITHAVDYSVTAGYAWSNNGTASSDIYKLTGPFTAPTRAPVGKTEHNEYDINVNGSMESWTGSVPDSWTVVAEGSSAVAKETSSPARGLASAKLTVDGSASDVYIHQTITLAASTNYLLRIEHKETGTAQLQVQIYDATANKYWSNAGWVSDATWIPLPTKSTYSETYTYFTSAGANSYKISVGHPLTATSQTIYCDDVFVLPAYLVNDPFIVTKADWQRVERGINITNLLPGEWAYDGISSIYYRLENGESIDSVAIRIAQGVWGDNGNGLYTDKAGTIIENINLISIPKYSIYIAADGCTVRKNTLRYGDIGVIVFSGADTSLVYYNIAIDQWEYGYYIMANDSAFIANNDSYGTRTNSGFFVYADATNPIFRNNASAESYDKDFKFETEPTGFLASNNLCTKASPSWGTVVSDLKFKSVSTGDFHLLPGSPCINKGVNVGLTSDFAGRPVGALPDIGAYEFFSNNGGGNFGNLNFSLGW